MWAVLLSLAASYGIDWIINNYNRKKAAKENLTQDDILRAVSAITNSAKAKGEKDYNEVLNRLNALPPIVATGALKSHIIKATNALKKDVDEKYEDMVDKGNKLSSIENRANMLASASDSYRKSAVGKRDYANIMQDVKDITNNVEKRI